MKRALVLAMLAGCVAGSSLPEPSQMFTNREHGYSVGQPAGWSTSEDRGATRFAPSHGKQTIVVRSAPRPGQIVEGKATTHEDVTEATRAALQRLTRQKLAEPTLVDGELPGTRFSFTFRPPSVGKPYHRTHVVLIGERRLFQVIQTAPLDEKLDDKAMHEMVATLVEEG